MAADVEGVERELEELHHLSREGFFFVEVCLGQALNHPRSCRRESRSAAQKYRTDVKTWLLARKREVSARVISEIDFFGL